MGEMAMSGKLTTKGEEMRISMEVNMGEALGGMEMNMDMDGLTKLPFISLDQ